MTLNILILCRKEFNCKVLLAEMAGYGLKLTSASLENDFSRELGQANVIVLIYPSKNLENLFADLGRIGPSVTKGQQLWLCMPSPLKRSVVEEKGVKRVLEPLGWTPKQVAERILAQVVVELPVDLTSFGALRGASEAMKEIFKKIEKVAPLKEPALILGETGVGKDLVASELHRASKLPGKMAAVNSAEFSANLLESELFGHVAGAFSGAVKDRDGLIIGAGRGSFFLDEIGDLSAELQAKLLRTIQNREVRPVGSNKTTRFDARLLFATHQNLSEKVTAGDFREDLFYRINAFTIEVAPLRERRVDTLLMADHFLRLYNLSYKRTLVLADGCLDQLFAADWPGNARQLQNVINRAAAYSDGDILDATELSEAMRGSQQQKVERGPSPDIDPETMTWETAQARNKAFYFGKLVESGRKSAEAIEMSGMSKGRYYEIIKSLGLSKNSQDDKEKGPLEQSDETGDNDK